MNHPTERTDLRTLAADTAWQHYGRRAGRIHAVSAEFGVPDWFQVTCDCNWVGALWRSRDGAERQHAAHLADEVRAALLPAHRKQVLDEAANDLNALLTNAMRTGRTNAGLDAYSGASQVVDWLQRLAATGLPNGVPGENDDAWCCAKCKKLAEEGL